MRSLCFYCLAVALGAGCSNDNTGKGGDLAGTMTAGMDASGAPGKPDAALPGADAAAGQDARAANDLAADLESPRDLTAAVDFTVPLDFAMPEDLSSSDLTTPPDLTVPCAARCPNGCCQGTTCVVPAIAIGCATGGAACAACVPGTADRCTAGLCACGNTGLPCPAGLACVGGSCQCTALSCGGCCADAVTCVATPTAVHCGAHGSTCVNCTPTANLCVAGACTCNGNATCAAHAVCEVGGGCACDQTSCGTGGQCTPISVTSCGVGGGACMTCDPRKANRCDPNSGQCLCGTNFACGAGLYCDTTAVPTCKCDLTPITGCLGCCTADGLSCIAQVSDLQCGLHGATCQNCAQSGDTCNAATGSCLDCAMRCGGQNNGCCSGTVCTPVAQETALAGCGTGGAACVGCGTAGDRCVNGACSCGAGGKACGAGLECISGSCVCDVNSCPNGCCNNNACTALGVAACGLPGGACATCDPNLADSCVAGGCSCGASGAPCQSGSLCLNGTCQCDAQSCPNGCCRFGLCLLSNLDDCGTAGQACTHCDPVAADNCSAAGVCGCGNGAPCGAGLSCNSGACQCATDPCSTCATAAATRSYIGCEYWPTVLGNVVWSVFDFAAVVANPQAVDATVTVTGPGNFSSTTTVAAGSLAKIYLPWVTDLKGPDSDSCGDQNEMTASVSHAGGAYHLTSSVPVSVFQFNALEYAGQGGPPGKSWANCPGSTQSCFNGFQKIFLGCYSFTNDASLLLPTTAMTGTYRVMGQRGDTYNSGPVHTPFVSPYLGITGTTNNTMVTVKLASSATILAGTGVPATAAGGTATFTINAGDVLELLSAKGSNSDLSGSLVSATNPVQVITGTQCEDNPSGTAACDHLESSNFPAETLGKHYAVTVPTGPHSTPIGHTVRLYGNFANTNLTYNPTVAGAPAQIQAGQVVDLGIITNDFVVTGDQPFAVGSFMLGGNLVDPNESPSLGDPSQSLSVAIEQYRLNYIFLAPSDYVANYADVVVPNGATFTLDGVTQAQAPVAIGTSGYGVVRILLGAGNAGAHVLSATLPVGIQVLGYGAYTSYQYPGGLDLTLIAGKPMGG